MEFIVWIAVLFMVGSAVANVRTKNQIGRMLTGTKTSAAPKALEAPKDEHRLVRTWIVSTRDGRIDAGWRWKCSCGVWGLASGAYSKAKGGGFTEYELGTEKQAISGFKDHATLYREANSDFHKERADKLETEFAEYRKACYCKETNHELIPWKDK